MKKSLGNIADMKGLGEREFFMELSVMKDCSFFLGRFYPNMEVILEVRGLKAYAQ